MGTVMIRVCLAAFALLLLLLQRVNSDHNVVRKRREWVLPARTLEENVDYTQKEHIAKIRSDFELESDIHYSLEGIGANQYPFHVFVVDPKTGLIRVTKVLDREFIDMYNLSGVATYPSGKEAERKIDIRIKVLDENDNAPKFGFIQPGEVKELSPVGTSVMDVAASDADEPNNENSQVAYSIVAQDPPDDMFSMDPNGTISVKKPTLDRETQDQYILTVKGQDLNGKPEGNTGTGTVTINVADVNDNPPTLEKTAYEGSIEENTQGVEVLRFKTQDLDLKGTDNWEAVFDIVKGNEAGYFSVRTDPLTNEGVLMLDKAVDYEDVKDLDLGIAVRNKAPPYDGSGASTQVGVGFGGPAGGANGASGAGGGSGGSGPGGAGGAGGPSGPGGAGGAGGPSGPGGAGGASGPGGAGGGSGPGGAGAGSGGVSSQTPVKTYPVKINVKNQPEGPHFDPKVKAIPVSAKGPINIQQVIGTYPAIDGDTGKPAENVKYAKGSDPNNWLSIDPATAEIRLNKKPDRDSRFLVNGTYIAKVLCITEDMPAKTATGTIAIEVEGSNEQCPTLTSNFQTMCTRDDAVIVNAVDKDAYPNGPPFDFKIISGGTGGKWQVEHLNETAAILRTHESLWPGSYEVELNVTDEQGQACPEPQKVKVHVCVCEAGMPCMFRESQRQADRKTELGALGIGMLLLGLLLLLLVPLLLFFCLCGERALLPESFTEMPFDTKSHLINYHTEGIGENAEVPLLTIPPQVAGDVLGAGMGLAGQTYTAGVGAGFGLQKSVTSMDGMNRYTGAADDYNEATWGANQEGGAFYTDFKHTESGAGGGFYDGMALPDAILRQYYSQKAAGEDESVRVKDSLLVYDYEGQGSAAGSVGCCSLLEADNDLQFLDDLGPKFKTLAEVCGGKALPATEKQVPTPLPNMSINPQTSLSSMVSLPELPSVPKPQQTVHKSEQRVVRETPERSQVVKESTATLQRGVSSVKQGMANQGQMLLVQQQQQQQPVYYTTTPVLQPLQYVVQPQVHNTVLLAEAPTTNLQGMILVNGTSAGPAQGVVVQGQAQGPGMVLVQRGDVQSNLIQAAHLSGSQPMLLVDGKVSAGTLTNRKGSQTCLVSGGLQQSRRLLGSQRSEAAPAQGVVVQGQTLMSSRQGHVPGVVLMDGSGLQGLSTNLIHTGSQSMMVVEGTVPAGRAAKGSHGSLVQGGPLQTDGMSRSAKVLLVEGPISSGGRVVQDLCQKTDVSGSQQLLNSIGSTLPGSPCAVVASSTTTASKTPAYRKLVVEETKTLRSLDSLQ